MPIVGGNNEAVAQGDAALDGYKQVIDFESEKNRSSVLCCSLTVTGSAGGIQTPAETFITAPL
ncbi:hypothetical protein [Sodalis praecaptivus]|uniref:hypothetical protein n=1 Tax=Sodalis praecaptivus TaxID=1239307 RepID=UPI00280B6C5A|nr:hypothetical protein [Sodalis praecaptivus]